MSQKSGTPKLSAEQVVKDIRRATRAGRPARRTQHRGTVARGIAESLYYIYGRLSHYKPILN